MYTRPSWPPSLLKEFNSLSSTLGYKSKGKMGKWLLIQKLLAYAKEHSDIFKH